MLEILLQDGTDHSQELVILLQDGIDHSQELVILLQDGIDHSKELACTAVETLRLTEADNSADRNIALLYAQVLTITPIISPTRSSASAQHCTNYNTQATTK